MTLAPAAYLFYGPPGGGKTTLGVSAFWDFKKQEKIREGRLLLFGSEENEALGVPEEMIKRFSHPDKPLTFVKEFVTYMKARHQAVGKPGEPEVYCFDGMSEWNTSYLYEHQESRGDTGWDRWNEAKDHFIQVIKLMNPKALNADVIVTARVDEVRRAVKNRRGDEVVPADPAWITEDSQYVPAMTGKWPRQNLGHFFALVSYVEAGRGQVEGSKKEVPIHRYYMLPHEGFLVKNHWEYQWVQAGKPDYLVNATFDSLRGEIEDAVQKSTASGPGDSDAAQ